MPTSLYLPFNGFSINNKEGNRILFDSIIRSGPSYNLVVHESPTWLQIKDEISNKKLIEIITKKKQEEYIELIEKYFEPVIGVGKIINEHNNVKYTHNLISSHIRTLTHIVIAHDYKARICDFGINMILDDAARKLELNSHLFSEEAIIRTKFVEAIIDSYNSSYTKTLSISNDLNTYDEIQNILDNEKIKILSEKNDMFRILEVNKNKLMRDISIIIDEIIHSNLLPLISVAPFTILSYCNKQLEYLVLIDKFSRILNYILNNRKFRTQAPVFQIMKTFDISEEVFTYTIFNYKYRYDLKTH